MMPNCHLCRKPVENLDHQATDGSTAYICDVCFDRLTEGYRRLREQRTRELMRCDGCGALPGTGCSCPDNARAIHQGERAKAAREEA